MTEEKNNEVLSTVEYWDSVLTAAKLPRINSYQSYYIPMNFFDEVLKNESKKTLMEIGAGSSGWLPYFSQKYGYKVSGLDYSEIGCKIGLKNLEMTKVDFDEMICEDIFKWNSPKKYDVIFSYGVIEHFEHPEKILKICHDHLNKDGIIITVVPNLAGLMGSWSKRFVPDIFAIHKIIKKDELKRLHLENGFSDLKTGYAGTMSIHVIPWIRSNHFLFRENSIQKKISMFAIKAFGKVFSTIDRGLKVNLPSRYLSPYVISIMRKVE